MRIPQTVFLETEFVALILVAVVAPIAIYAYFVWKRAISRRTVLLLGMTLIGISAASVALLQRLKAMALLTPSQLDDRIFASEISLALYLMPVVFAGIGINIISNLLIRHLDGAEERFDRAKVAQRDVDASNDP
jgi:hypothetical protein